MRLEYLLGALAAFCTTVSYVPQLRKVWTTRKTDDLSLRMLLLLAAGLTLWAMYGLVRSDLVIIAANGVSLALLAALISCKVRYDRQARRKQS